MSDGNFTNNIPRDRYDRPIIYPAPARGKTHSDVVERYAKQKKQPKSYRRTTKFISILEDNFNLERWAQRMVARGLSELPDLAASVAAIPDIDTQIGKDALDMAVKDARAHMRTSLKANKGSYLHHCTELLDRFGETAELPSPAEWASLQNGNVDLRDDDYTIDERDADVAAYLSAKQRYGLRYYTIEQMRVYDPWQVAGTPDRSGVGTDERFAGKHMIMDVKTGDVDWDNTQREIAMQLAMYAHSTPYTHDQGRGEDVPAVNRQKAVVIHLPAGQGRCELHFVDIVRGWQGCLHAQNVWEWRKFRAMFVKADEWSPTGHLERLAMNPSYAEAAMTCPSKAELRTLWEQAAKAVALTDDFKSAVRKRINELETSSKEGAA